MVTIDNTLNEGQVIGEKLDISIIIRNQSPLHVKIYFPLVVDKIADGGSDWMKNKACD